MLKALSLAANQPAPAQAALTVPADTALTVSAAGTSFPGSLKLSATSLPVARATRSVSRLAASPRSGMLPGKVLAISIVTGLPGSPCAAVLIEAMAKAIAPANANFMKVTTPVSAAALSAETLSPPLAAFEEVSRAGLDVS